ncbi:MAG: NADPH-dependent FMN reductase [Cyanobacteriota bacterium]|jgi:chromate reductase
MIEIVSGTNRANCNTLRIAQMLLQAYRALEVEAHILNLQELPPEILNPGAYGEKPAAFAPFQERVLQARGLHVVTPEYNGSFPGVLKLFIDMLRFPDSLEGKPVAFTGLAAGQWGGLRPVEQLQMVFAYRNAYAFPQRVFIPGVQGVLDGEAGFNDGELRQRLVRQADGFVAFLRQLGAGVPGRG